jgi:predicted secreted protein
MLQQFRGYFWLPGIVALSLVSACAQPNTPQIEPSPATSPPQTQATPSKGTGRSTETPQNPRPIAEAPNAPTPSPNQKPNLKVQGGKAPTATDSLQPTFRARQRIAGFSADGRHFIYLESSRDTGAGIPKSSLQVVNVATNACVENGCLSTRYQESDAGLQMSDAEENLLQKTWSMRQVLKLTPPVSGTALPVIERSRTKDGIETVTVIGDEAKMQLRLQQQQIRSALNGGTAEQDKAAMQIQVSYDGKQRSLDSLNNFRDRVLEYSIREVRLSPDGKRVAVLLTATTQTFEGTLGTTLVQGFDR